MPSPTPPRLRRDSRPRYRASCPPMRELWAVCDAARRPQDARMVARRRRSGYQLRADGLARDDGAADRLRILDQLERRADQLGDIDAVVRSGGGIDLGGKIELARAEQT